MQMYSVVLFVTCGMYDPFLKRMMALKANEDRKNCNKIKDEKNMSALMLPTPMGPEDPLAFKIEPLS